MGDENLHRYTPWVRAKSPYPKPQPTVPDSLPLADALMRNSTLANLRQRLSDSNARFAAIHALLPAALAAHVTPGPVDDEGWTLLCANTPVAAKLRQLQPRLEELLHQRGWQVSRIRIKVQSRS